jgi:hypothetical protein
MLSAEHHAGVAGAAVLGRGRCVIADGRAVVRSGPSADAGLPAARRFAGPEAEHLEIVATTTAGEEPVTREARK